MTNFQYFRKTRQTYDLTIFFKKSLAFFLLIFWRENSILFLFLYYSRRKVLAGIVMTKDGATMEDMEVISVTTGTKCVNGEHMSVNGNSLNGKKAKYFLISTLC